MSASLANEKRCATRHPVDLAATLTRCGSDQTEFWQSTIINLNISGLQLECSFSTLQELMPNITRPDPNRPVEINVQFQLPGTNYAIEAQCSMLYLRRLARDRFLSGGRFTLMDSASQQRLEQFLHSA